MKYIIVFKSGLRSVGKFITKAGEILFMVVWWLTITVMMANSIFPLLGASGIDQIMAYFVALCIAAILSGIALVGIDVLSTTRLFAFPDYWHLVKLIVLAFGLQAFTASLGLFGEHSQRIEIYSASVVFLYLFVKHIGGIVLKDTKKEIPQIEEEKEKAA